MRNPRDLRLVLGLLLSVTIVVLSGCPKPPKPKPTVPNVVGMTQASAEQTIRDAGLSPGVSGQEYSATVPVGVVIRQDPEAGTQVNENSQVSLTISLGPQPHVSQPVIIGALLPLQGPWAAIGEHVVAALDMALEETVPYLIESDEDGYYWGMAHDEIVQIVVRDTGGDPGVALQQLQALKAQGVQVVVGPLTSAEAAAVVAYANAQGMLLISPSSTAGSLSLNDNLFRLIPNDTQQARALAMLMAQDGIERAVVAYLDDAYGNGLFADLDTALASQGVTLLGGVALNPANYRGALPALAGAVAVFDPATTAVVLIGSGEDLAGLAGAMGAKSDLDALKWYAGDGIVNEPETLADPAGAALAAQVGLEGFTLPAINDLPSVGLQMMVCRMMERLGAFPSPFALRAWESVWLIVEVYRQDHEPSLVTLKRLLRNTFDNSLGVFGLPNGFDANGDSTTILYSRFEAGTNVSGAVAWNFRGMYADPSSGAPYLSEGPAPMSAETGRVVLKAILPRTGSFEPLAHPAIAAGLYAVEDANRYFGLLGSGISFELDYEDTQSDAATAERVFRVIVDTGAAVAVGPITDFELAAVENADDELGLPLLSTASTAPSLGKPDRILRLAPPDGRQADALAALLEARNVAHVVVLYRDDTYGRDFDQVFTEGFDGVAAHLGYATDMTDFSSLLTEAATALGALPASTSAVLAIGFDELAGLLKQIPTGSALLNVSWYGTDGIALSNVLTNDVAAAARASALDLTCSSYSHEALGRFVPTKKVFDRHINISTAGLAETSAYEAYWLAMYAYLQAGPDVKPNGAWPILSAQDLDGDAGTGICVPIVFDANGDQTMSAYAFYQVVNGSWETVAYYRNTTFAPNELILRH